MVGLWSGSILLRLPTTSFDFLLLPTTSYDFVLPPSPENLARVFPDLVAHFNPDGEFRLSPVELEQKVFIGDAPPIMLQLLFGMLYFQ